MREDGIVSINDIKDCVMDKPYVFISYSHKDEQVVWRDVIEFQKRGYNIWIDKNLKKTSESWKDDALKAIKSRRCQLVLFYLSVDSLVSQACFDEMEKARADDTKRTHNSEIGVKFIAIDVEEIRDIKSLKDRCYSEQERMNDEGKITEVEFDERVDTMNDFIDKYFNLNNERNRVKAKAINPSYYNDIVVEEFKKTKIFESTADIGSESIEISPAASNSDNRPEPAVVSQSQQLEGREKEKINDPVISTPETKAMENREAEPDEKPVNIKQSVNDQRRTKQPEADTGLKERQNEKKEKSDQSKLKEGVGAGRSSTGDLSYELYGTHYEGTQSDLMIMSIGKVLKNNPEIIDEAIESFTCLSDVDYENQNKADKPSYFRVCHTVVIEGKQVCIGTAYGIKDKLTLIAKIISLAEEDPSILKIDGLELPEVAGRSTKGRGNAADVSFELYGKQYNDNQSGMMAVVVKGVLENHPEVIDEALEKIAVLSPEDYESKKVVDRPSYFKNCRTYIINGRKVCIGLTCGKMDEKLRYMANVISIAGEESSILKIDGYELPEVDSEDAGKRGNIVSYELYGVHHEENQSDFMITVFEEVLNKNPEMIDESVESFSCLSNVDYENQSKKDRPSYFRGCHTVLIKGKQVCIGTAYGIKDKLTLIAKIISLAEEDPSILKIDGLELPEVAGRSTKGRGNAADVSFELYGKQYNDNQSGMMAVVIREVLTKHPDTIEEALEKSAALSSEDYENKKVAERPSLFKNCRTYQIEGRQVCVGLTMGKDEKLRQIANVIAIADEDPSILKIDGMEIPELTSSAGGRRKANKNYDI